MEMLGKLNEPGSYELDSAGLDVDSVDLTNRC